MSGIFRGVRLGARARARVRSAGCTRKSVPHWHWSPSRLGGIHRHLLRCQFIHSGTRPTADKANLDLAIADLAVRARALEARSQLEPEPPARAGPPAAHRARCTSSRWRRNAVHDFSGNDARPPLERKPQWPMHAGSWWAAAASCSLHAGYTYQRILRGRHRGHGNHNRVGGQRRGWLQRRSRHADCGCREDPRDIDRHNYKCESVQCAHVRRRQCPARAHGFGCIYGSGNQFRPR